MSRRIQAPLVVALTTLTVAVAAACSSPSSPQGESRAEAGASPRAAGPSSEENATGKEETEVHWTYAGRDPSKRWAKLHPEWTTCADGSAQSPIDLGSARPRQRPDVNFAWREVSGEAVDTGHTLQVNFPPDSSVHVAGEKFTLLQVHMHAPSEHVVGGRRFPAEFHFVHRDEEDRLAVVGVFAEKAATSQREWGDLVKALVSPGRTTPLDLPRLLPEDERAYDYSGSLTTPPCTEGVSWYVLRTSVQLADGDLDRLRTAYQDNARPLQDRNGRPVHLDTATDR